MPDSQPSLRKARFSLAFIAGSLGVCGLVLIVAVAAYVALAERSRRFDRAEREAQNDAFFLADHAARLFEVADVGLRAAAAATRDLSWDAIAASGDLHRQLRDLASALPHVEDVWLNDRDGVLRATSFGFPAPASNAKDRENFKAAERGNAAGGMAIGPPIVGRVTKQPTFLLSRRLEDAGGTFRGMVSVTADLNYFSDYWRRLRLPFDAHVTLFRAGTLERLASLPEDGGPERDPGSDTILSQAISRDTDAGLMRAADGAGLGTDRFGAFRRVSDLPLYVGVTLSRNAVEAAYREWLETFAPFVVAAFVTLVLLTALAVRQASREAQDRAALFKARAHLFEANRDLTAQMRGRQDAEDQLRQSQKMEAVGQLTGGIAHDFNNMLAVIMGALDLLLRRIERGEVEPETLKRYANAALDGASRAATLTQRLLAFARRQPLAPETVNANRLVAGMSELMRRTLGETVQLETVLAGGLWRIHVDSGQLENALLNLGVNARDAMADASGRLTIETANCHLDEGYARDNPDATPGQYVMIAVSDTGRGMQADVIGRAFEPFFTTKASGKGTGLGLSQVYGFVKQSGGHIKIYSEPGHGTTVKLYLPRFVEAPDAAPGPAAKAMEAPRARPGETILLVEDDERVRHFGIEALGDLGYDVIEAENAAEALELLDAHPEVVLLFTDVVMPDGSGKMLADEAMRRRPDLKVLFTTGYTQNAVVHNGILDPGTNLLGKPFSLDQLAARVRAVLGADREKDNDRRAD